MARITKRTVEAARPAEHDVFLWDDAIPGFGVRVLPSGRRAYVIQYRVNGRTRRLTLGPHGTLTPEQARRRAAQLLAAARAGSDPSAERHASARAMTVEGLATRYLEPARRAQEESGVCAQASRPRYFWFDLNHIHG